MNNPIIYICNRCSNQTAILINQCNMCGFSSFSKIVGNQVVQNNLNFSQVSPNLQGFNKKTYACQNCLYELHFPASSCNFCKEFGTIVLKNQIPFFEDGQKRAKPKFLYCQRCSFKTVRPLTDCPRCASGIKGVLYGQHLTRLTTKKSKNNFEIFAGIVLIFFGLLAIPIMFIFLFSKSGTPKLEGELIFIGATGFAIFLFGLIVLIKGTISRVSGGR